MIANGQSRVLGRVKKSVGVAQKERMGQKKKKQGMLAGSTDGLLKQDENLGSQRPKPRTYLLRGGRD